MSAQEIDLDGGLGVRALFRALDDMVVVEVTDGFNKLSAVMDRGDQHLLLLYLQERLGQK